MRSERSEGRSKKEDGRSRTNRPRLRDVPNSPTRSALRAVPAGRKAERRGYPRRGHPPPRPPWPSRIFLPRRPRRRIQDLPHASTFDYLPRKQVRWLSLDPFRDACTVHDVSVLQIKQGLSRLSAKEQREVQIYLHQLRRRTSAWKKSTAKKIAEVQAGKFTTIEQLEELHRRG